MVCGVAVAIMLGGVLLYYLTDQTLVSYLVGLAGLAVAVVGIFVTVHNPASGPSSSVAIESRPQVRSNLQADEAKLSEIIGIDTTDDDHSDLSSRMRLGRVIGSKVTGVRFRSQGKGRPS
jgi:hypothetical protein